MEKGLEFYAKNSPYEQRGLYGENEYRYMYCDRAGWFKTIG